MSPREPIDGDALLKRYLIAEEFNVAKATERLSATVRWRCHWRVLEYESPGAARRLFEPATNPGSEMYFADIGLRDKHGRPALVGRLRMCNASAMHPFNHLRAGIFVIERGTSSRIPTCLCTYTRALHLHPHLHSAPVPEPALCEPALCTCTLHLHVSPFNARLGDY